MKVLFFALFTFLLSFPYAQAGIVPDGTRVIFPATKRDVTFGISNNSASPRLIQAWVDDGDPQSTPGSATAPFVITPPVFRLNGVECENPSAFNVSVNDIGFNEHAENTRERNNGMCPAKGTKIFVIKQNLKPGNNRLYLTTVNDYGGLDKQSATYSK